MTKLCPNPICAAPHLFIKDGTFKRREDSKTIQRYRCKNCLTRFSNATFTATYRQKKRRINAPLLKLKASGVSLRRSALLLNVSRRTIERRLPFLGARCRKLNERHLRKFKGKVHNIQIDDLITKENSKLKPLTVSVVVDEDSRTILALEVSQIPAFGHLSKLAVKKYGKREDQHFEGLSRLFQRITQLVSPEVLVKSDEHQRYPGFVATYLPKAQHQTFKSQRGAIVGQGELKKIAYDPLFIINHTLAMMRANVNRLFRRTWCTTKSPERLKDHLDIFMYFYNTRIIPPS